MSSLKQIAKSLDISYTLVSKVLSGRMGTTGASTKTREAIFKKAKELDYVPNRMAVALKSGRKDAIAVFLHNIESPGSDATSLFLESIAKAVEGTQHRLWIRFFNEDQELLESCNENLKRDVDGLIVGGVEPPNLIERLRKIDRNGLPIVSVFPDRGSASFYCNIYTDQEAQCYLTTQHLLKKGCRRIAHFKTSSQRYQGYVRAHKEAKAPLFPHLIIPSKSFNLEDGLIAVKALLELKEDFDGIVTQSDAQAIGAIRVLQKKGLRIPEDVKITGVNNSPVAETSLIPLTSSSSEIDQCGRLATEMLLKKISGKSGKSASVSPRLVIRESTGAENRSL